MFYVQQFHKHWYACSSYKDSTWGFCIWPQWGRPAAPAFYFLLLDQHQLSPCLCTIASLFCLSAENWILLCLRSWKKHCFLTLRGFRFTCARPRPHPEASPSPWNSRSSAGAAHIQRLLKILPRASRPTGLQPPEPSGPLTNKPIIRPEFVSSHGFPVRYRDLDRCRWVQCSSWTFTMSAPILTLHRHRFVEEGRCWFSTLCLDANSALFYPHLQALK